MDRHRDPDAVQEIDYAMIKIGDCPRLQWKFPFLPVAGERDEAVSDEIKLDLKDFAAGWDRRGAKSASSNVEGGPASRG